MFNVTLNKEMNKWISLSLNLIIYPWYYLKGQANYDNWVLIDAYIQRVAKIICFALHTFIWNSNYRAPSAFFEI